MSPDESTDAQPPLPLPLVAVSGLCMGAADAVPGVSGGTIALILGVYQRFIEAIGTCLKVLVPIRSPEGRTKLVAALRFLVPLGVGVVVAYWLGTRLLVGPSDAKGLMRRAETAPLCYANTPNPRRPRRLRSSGRRHG